MLDKLTDDQMDELCQRLAHLREKHPDQIRRLKELQERTKGSGSDLVSSRNPRVGDISESELITE